jgi:hypothetical protein
VNVVGHPEGRLKKWSEGTVVDWSGDWVWTTAFILAGNSGSAILDDQGNLVGLIHSGPKTDDSITNDGVNEFSVGTASGPLAAAMGAPLPGAVISTSDPLTEADVVADERVFLNGRVPTANVGGTSEPVVTALGNACDQALAQTAYASVGELSAGLQPCLAATLWIDCQSDAMPSFSVCPANPADWVARYRSVFERWQMLDGAVDWAMMTTAPAALALTSADGLEGAVKNAQQILASLKPALDFEVAAYLAILNIDSYAGTTIVDFVRGYNNVTGYWLSGSTIVVTVLALNQWGRLADSETQSLLGSLAADDRIDIGAKLYIEQVLYDSKVLQ